MEFPKNIIRILELTPKILKEFWIPFQKKHTKQTIHLDFFTTEDGTVYKVLNR